MALSEKLSGLLTQERIDKAKQQLQQVVNSGLDRHVRLAVTGLSQSGKTAFITALVDHLLHSHNSRALPFFQVSNDHRVLGVRLQSPDSSLSEFPYQQGIGALSADPPDWPESTRDLSTIRLAIRYKPRSRLHQLVSETATLYLEINDYPGEWLLDLPLLELSYRQWCHQQQRLFESAPRAQLAASWLEAVRGLNPQSAGDDNLVALLSEQYRLLLTGFRQSPHRLSLIQPGRFILPGDLEGSPLLQFFPLFDLPEAESDDSRDSQQDTLYQLLERRYEDYREQVVRRFYSEHFSRFDRQVVLVDCLKTLNSGQTCFDDMQLAITRILESFNYGRSGLLRRLFSPRIDRVLFASTKADHVTASQHHNLECFLELIVDEARRDISFEGIDTRSMALSAFRSTEAAEAMVDGQKLSCLKGLRKGSHEPVALFPGEVPVELPGAEDWSSERFNFLDFAPPPLSRVRGKAASHIRMDQALEFLLGDKFL